MLKRRILSSLKWKLIFENSLYAKSHPCIQFSSLQFSCLVMSDSLRRQASLSITNSHSLLRLMSIESVMPSKHLIFCVHFSSCFQSFPASGSFQISQLFTSGGQSIGASVSVLPMNTQGLSSLGWTG